MPKINKKTTTRRAAVKKSVLPTVEAFLAASGSAVTDQAALDLLIKIVRGEQIELCDNEMKPASLSQRIAAAQILLKLRERDMPAVSPSPVDAKSHPIDAPERAATFDEWLLRQKRLTGDTGTPTA